MKKGPITGERSMIVVEVKKVERKNLIIAFLIGVVVGIVLCIIDVSVMLMSR